MGDDSKKVVPLHPDQDAKTASGLVGRAIRFMRRDRKMTQQELGDILGVSGQRIQKMETGHEQVSAVHLEKLAKAFGVEASAFFSAEYETGVVRSVDDDLAKLQSECMHLIRHVSDTKGLLLVKDALLKLAR